MLRNASDTAGRRFGALGPIRLLYALVIGVSMSLLSACTGTAGDATESSSEAMMEESGEEVVPLVKVDPPPESIPIAAINGVEGLRVFESWWADGELVETEVPLAELELPGEVPVAEEVVIVFNTSSFPGLADALEYPEVPTDDSHSTATVWDCLSADEACSVDLDGNGNVTISLPVRPDTSILVVNVAWDLPEDYRSEIGFDGDRFSAAWLFHVVPEGAK